MGQLIAGRDAAGDRYYLDGRPVHCGDVVELHVDGHQWVSVRLEGMPDTVRAHMPLQGGIEAWVSLPVGAELRWPLARRLQPIPPQWEPPPVFSMFTLSATAEVLVRR